jgi:hypothetical protein
MPAVSAPKSQIGLYKGAQHFEMRVVFKIGKIHCGRSLVIASRTCQEFTVVR